MEWCGDGQVCCSGNTCVNMAGRVFGVPTVAWGAIVAPYLSLKELLALRCVSRALKRGVESSLEPYKAYLQWEIDLIVSDPFMQSVQDQISRFHMQAKESMHQVNMRDICEARSYIKPPEAITDAAYIITLLLTGNITENAYVQFRRLGTMVVKQLIDFPVEMSPNVTKNVTEVERFLAKWSVERLRDIDRFALQVYEYMNCVATIGKLRGTQFESREKRCKFLREERGKTEKLIRRLSDESNSREFPSTLQSRVSTAIPFP